jgi:hypothetical protein
LEFLPRRSAEFVGDLSPAGVVFTRAVGREAVEALCQRDETPSKPAVHAPPDQSVRLDDSGR